MTTVAQQIASQFATHDFITGAVFDGFTEAAWTAPAHDAVNHPLWVLCHVTEIRRGIAANLGHTAGAPAEPKAGFGSAKGTAADFPPPADLLAEFLALGRVIGSRLAEASPELLEQPFVPNFPDGGTRSIRDALSFLLMHEALHCGQVSLMRRLNGLPGVAEVALARLGAAKSAG